MEKPSQFRVQRPTGAFCFLLPCFWQQPHSVEGGWIPFSRSSHFTKNTGIAKKATEHKYVYSRGMPARMYITSKCVRGERMPLFGC